MAQVQWFKRMIATRSVVSSLPLLLLFGCTTRNATGPPSYQVDFCHLEVPHVFIRGNATFALTLAFQVDSQGVPQSVDVLKNMSHVDQVAIEACLSRWRFPDLPTGSKLLAVFQWKHGRGWESLSIIGNGFRQRIDLSGNRCPYPNCAGPREDPQEGSAESGATDRPRTDKREQWR